MRHNKHHSSLGVTREHRRAMLSNLAVSLITHGRIETTLTKAKTLRPFIEKVITKAKQAAAKTEAKDAIHLRRLALRDVRDEDAVTLLFNEKHKEFTARNGGYTRIYKLGRQKLSDAAEMTFTLETGRTHQIRVHLAAYGHPIVNDIVYGKREPRSPLPGQALHAGHLAFKHPVTKEPLAFTVDPPPDYLTTLERLR